MKTLGKCFYSEFLLEYLAAQFKICSCKEVKQKWNLLSLLNQDSPFKVSSCKGHEELNPQIFKNTAILFVLKIQISRNYAT